MAKAGISGVMAYKPMAANRSKHGNGGGGNQRNYQRQRGGIEK